MAVALPGFINGSGFGSAKMSPRDGSEKQRSAAKMPTARDDLYVSDQDYRRRFLAQPEDCKPLGQAPAKPKPNNSEPTAHSTGFFASPGSTLYGRTSSAASGL